MESICNGSLNFGAHGLHQIVNFQVMFYVYEQAADNIYDHEVSIIAHSYLPVDGTSIPTGKAI